LSKQHVCSKEELLVVLPGSTRHILIKLLEVPVNSFVSAIRTTLRVALASMTAWMASRKGNTKSSDKRLPKLEGWGKCAAITTTPPTASEEPSLALSPRSKAWAMNGRPSEIMHPAFQDPPSDEVLHFEVLYSKATRSLPQVVCNLAQASGMEVRLLKSSNSMRFAKSMSESCNMARNAD